MPRLKQITKVRRSLRLVRSAGNFDGRRGRSGPVAVAGPKRFGLGQSALVADQAGPGRQACQALARLALQDSRRTDLLRAEAHHGAARRGLGHLLLHVDPKPD
jgi:hypothetical protein